MRKLATEFWCESVSSYVTIRDTTQQVYAKLNMMDDDGDDNSFLDGLISPNTRRRTRE